MPKRIILIALAALATLAACNSGNINDIYGVATATPGPTSTPYVNPSASAAVVYVYASSSPLPGQPVSVYPATTSGQVVVGATPVATQTTDPTGQTTFSNLTPTAWYCFESKYMYAGSTTLLTQEPCIDWWGDSTGVVLSF